MNNTSDEALIQRIAKGERSAMRVLFARHQTRVFRFIVGMTRNEALSEDLVNDVFLDVWRQAGKFEFKSKVSTWLLAIARFKTFSALRRKREDELDDAYANSIADDADTPEVEQQKADKGALLRHCIEQLSVDHRTVIDLVYYHEKSVEDVAEILDVPKNTVKTRMFYARKNLSQLCKQAGIDRGWP